MAVYFELVKPKNPTMIVIIFLNVKISAKNCCVRKGAEIRIPRHEGRYFVATIIYAETNVNAGM